MDTVTLDGTVYLKATKAADLVGYAPDYIGQLCRKGTLDGIVLGKTWYVREGSLLEHRASKIRVNTATTRRDIQRQQKEQKNTSFSWQRNGLLETAVQYSPDTHDLLPSVVAEIPAYMDNPATNQTPNITPPDAEDVADTEKEESEDDIGTENYEDDTEEESEEIAVPIHITRTARTIIHKPTQRAEKEPTIRISRHAVKIYSPMLPILSVLLLLFVLANIVLESTWSYTNSAFSKARLETTYNLASVSAIMEVIQGIKF